MAFAFEIADETVEAGLRRIALEQLALALNELNGEDRAQAVHAARKRTKRLRALLRLVRGGFKAFGQETVALREAARGLSTLRDGAVLHQTLEAVAPKLAPEVAERLREALRARSADAGPNEAALLLRCHTALARVHARAGAWSLKRDGFNALGPDLTASYRQARRALARLDGRSQTDSSPDPKADERFHDWRKRVKHHLYHLDLLSSTAPTLLKGHRRLADDLAERIGEHHDAAVFLALLDADTDAFGGPEITRPATEALLARQETLEHQAFALGRELFAEAPSALAARLRRYWKTWRRHGALPDAA